MTTVPTYEYRCSDCGNLIEVFQRIDEEPLAVCERCGGRLRKVFHPAGIVFKGSGFYATDSRSKKTGAKEGGDKSTDKGASTSTSTSETASGGDSGGKKEPTPSGSGDSKKPPGSQSS